MGGLKVRAKTLKELAELAAFYVRQRPIAMDDKASRILTDDARALLRRLADGLRELEAWSAAAIESAVRSFAEQAGVKLGNVAQPLRAALAGSSVSPGIFEVMEVLGRDETLGRLSDAAPPV